MLRGGVDASNERKASLSGSRFDVKNEEACAQTAVMSLKFH